MNTLNTKSYIVFVTSGKVVSARSILTGRFVKTKLGQAEFDAMNQSKSDDWLTKSGIMIAVAFMCGYFSICFNGIFINTELFIFDLLFTITAVIGTMAFIGSALSFLKCLAVNISANYEWSF